ncbi:MAG: NUDIX domain-containing protein [Parcubacteria group bacterium]|nr:NUDIX domain-containing protein [Parcubacteria group bacterium]
MGYLINSYEKSITAQGVIIRKGGGGAPEIFLVHDRGKEYRKPAGWGLPGGKVEKEETPDDGLVREVEEETPFRVSGCYFLFSEEKNQGVNEIQVFLTEIEKETRAALPAAEEEIDGGRWFTPEEIFKAPFAGPAVENGIYFSHKARIFRALRLLNLWQPLAEENTSPPLHPPPPTGGWRRRAAPY